MSFVHMLSIVFTFVLTAAAGRDQLTIHQSTENGVVFQLGNITYFANTKYPKAVVSVPDGEVPGSERFMPISVLQANASDVNGDTLKNLVESYIDGDDVFTEDFLEAIYLSASEGSSMSTSAVDYFAGLDTKHIVLAPNCSHFDSEQSGSVSLALNVSDTLPPGPYLALRIGTSLSFATVYRLYKDSYRTFLYGTYDLNDGTGAFSYPSIDIPSFSYPAIPVPSRLYSLHDSRPFAGYRVAIKDLFDVKGLVTSGGSQAYAHISKPANSTAPSLQRIIDLGGQLVGKYKLAQFASGANPWDWQDEHYPFNPRGDGWLTCSASSSGGGCSIAAYEWLDFAIGSDTGSSMRRPAAVSGTFGQRPSQGMMSLENVIPLGGATDTAGVFSRDPYKWIYFSKHWYTPSLHQSPNITGLSPLTVPDTNAFPKTILYPTDYLPLNNSDAQPILHNFISNMSTIFNMKVKHFNFSATVAAASNPDVQNLTALNLGPLSIINSYTQYEEIAKPLITQWANLYGGRFPPIDSSRREFWHSYNESEITLDSYKWALKQKNAAVDWYEKHLQYSTPESCSESVMLYDIGTGGLPSYREQNLNNNPNASFLAVLPPGATMTGAGICPLYGCVDATIPIGQVPYYSTVTYHTEMVPVTINMVMKRGCDFVLYNMIEKLADHGVLATVKTGRTAF